MANAKKSLSARELLSLNTIRLRRERGLSQEALALDAQLHRTYVAHIERLRRNASIDGIEKLAVALGVPVHELFVPPK